MPAFMPWRKFWVREGKVMKHTSLAATALMLRLLENCDADYRMMRDDGTPMVDADIARAADMDARTVKRALGELEMRGAVSQGEDGAWTILAYRRASDAASDVGADRGKTEG